MTDGGSYDVREDAGPEDLLVEGNWEEVGWFEIPPPSATAPPAIQSPTELNTNEMGWENFEKLLLHLSREHDGAYEARRYGLRGQGQFGIDVVGFFRERRPTVYQAKAWRTFKAPDLEAAVKRYTADRRPFDAGRIVVAVRSDVSDTKSLEKLAELRKTHAPLEIELWDRQELSAILSNHHGIVRRFWSRSFADSFCGVAVIGTPDADANSITADAVLRGPIASLQLTEDVRRAEQLLGEGPSESALIFGAVAEHLESRGYGPHAVLIRQRQAEAFRAAGQEDAEAATLLSLGWTQIRAGDAGSARSQAGRHRRLEDASGALARSTAALDASAAYLMEHEVGLDDLAPFVDVLEAGDLHRTDALLLFVEEAIAARRVDLIEPRQAVIEEVAAGMAHTNEGLLTAARLRCCLADGTGQWDAFYASARDDYHPAAAALITARYARLLSFQPDPRAADARWGDAIERACMEGFNDDAADWLYSRRNMRLDNSYRVTWDLNEAYRHAQALHAAGTGSILPEASSARERGLDFMRDAEWPRALEALQRHLCRSVAIADMRGETDAHDLLGDVFMSTRRPMQSLAHYVAAGSVTRVEKLAETLGDGAIDLPIDLLTPRHAERTAAFAFAAAAADLIVDNDAAQWCSRAFAEFADHPFVSAPGSPDPWLSGMKAFASLASTSTQADAERFLGIGSTLIAREPNHYRFTDESQVLALAAIGHAHPSLSEAVIDQLLDALLADQQMADKAIFHGQGLMRERPERISSRLAEAAGSNFYAAFALVVAGAETEPCLPMAGQMFERSVAPRNPTPGSFDLGTHLPRTAYLISVLPEEDRVVFARTMVTLAGAVDDATMNRCDALRALRTVADSLPDVTRDELFEQAIGFALVEEDNQSPAELLLGGLDDPLRRFRVSLGGDSLEAAGLLAAAALARLPDDFRRVEQVSLGLLYGADDVALNTIAQALAKIPVDVLSLSADVLAAQSSHWLRAVAAVVWAQRDSEPENIGLRLAEDRSQHVRRSLATSLQPGERYEGVRAELSADPRRSIRSIVRVCD